MKKRVWEVEFKIDGVKKVGGGFESKERAKEFAQIKTLKGQPAKVVGSKIIEYLPI